MRVALTGGSTGIGASIVQKLSNTNHDVIVFDVSEPAEGASQWIKTDLSDPASIARAIEQADGTFDALINNAGLPPREGLTEIILKVNYYGFRAFLEGFENKLSAGASIVNTASRAGAMWQQNIEQVKALMATDIDGMAAFLADHEIDATRAYNLSKEAVIVYTMSQTERMIQKGFRMNAVSPAAVSTGILDDFTRAFGEKVAKNIARAGRPGHPEEIADIILFLTSPQSAWIKGQDITIDGGMSAMGMTDMMGLNNPA